MDWVVRILESLSYDIYCCLKKYVTDSVRSVDSELRHGTTT
jgi:hypothetical protein